MHILQLDPQYLDACRVRVEPGLQLPLRLLLDGLAADGQQFIERRRRSDRLHHRLGRGANGGFAIELAEQEIFRVREPIVHGRIQLDHILVAAKHERLLRFALKAPGAMLHVPFVGWRLGIRRKGCRAKTNLDDAHAARLNPSQTLDGPRQLVVDSGLAVGQYLLTEPLDDARFVRSERVNAVEEQHSPAGIHRGARQSAPLFDDAAELRGDVDRSEPFPDAGNGRRRDQPAQARLRRPLDAQQPQ